MTLFGTALLGLQGLLGVAMVAAGGAKLAGQESQVEDFDRFGYPQWFRILTGGLEVTAAVGLLTAVILTDAFALAGGLVVTAVLAGAIATHVRIGDPPSKAAPAAVLLTLALVVSGAHIPVIL